MLCWGGGLVLALPEERYEKLVPLSSQQQMAARSALKELEEASSVALRRAGLHFANRYSIP